jgi:hypothetical protein
LHRTSLIFFFFYFLFLLLCTLLHNEALGVGYRMTGRVHIPLPSRPFFFSSCHPLLFAAPPCFLFPLGWAYKIASRAYRIICREHCDIEVYLRFALWRSLVFFLIVLLPPVLSSGILFFSFSRPTRFGSSDVDKITWPLGAGFCSTLGPTVYYELLIYQEKKWEGPVEIWNNLRGFISGKPSSSSTFFPPCTLTGRRHHTLSLGATPSLFFFLDQ